MRMTGQRADPRIAEYKALSTAQTSGMRIHQKLTANAPAP